MGKFSGRGKPTNMDKLTSGSKIYDRKRKKKEEQVEEVVFDEESRYEYLTGFHKRNVERKKLAVEKAKERERLERIELRKETKQDRLNQLKDKLEQMDIEYGRVSDAEESGSEDDKDGMALEGLEYQDTHASTTVTVDQGFLDGEDGLDASGPAFVMKLLNKRAKAATSGSSNNREDDDGDSEDVSDSGNNSKRKTRKPTFRYETKADRTKAKIKTKAKTTARNQKFAEKRGSTSAKPRGKPGKKRKF